MNWPAGGKLRNSPPPPIQSDDTAVSIDVDVQARLARTQSRWYSSSRQAAGESDTGQRPYLCSGPHIGGLSHFKIGRAALSGTADFLLHFSIG